ncbi:carcinoembryonic antigen-related cell adhesion molecule 5-like [Amblyraja radiata]|uniref:carcinoembryonic antigen-related cell adhesion molecule 5-like n=1 Tax=Amblyraja radiata TaxID=386614 RepID=UPI001403A41A|nr:carcinoembryonic antigen-related cell adhesion molecule 5-like [Amblyraja radiata]
MALPPLTALAFCLVISTGGLQGFTVKAAQSDLYVPIGGDAVFTVRPSNAIENGTWYFKSKRIVQWLGTALVIHPEYTSRVDLNSNSGSLMLRSVNQSDNGIYTVSLTAVGGAAQASATITLRPVGGSQGFTVEAAQSDLYVRIGGDAEFTVRRSSAISGGYWVFKPKKIVSWIGTNAAILPEYRSRVDLNLNSGSLMLSSVNELDNGDYTVILNAVGGAAQDTATITLHALEPVENVTLRSNNSELVEQRDSVVMTCSSQGTQLKWEWLLNNQRIRQNNRIKISGDTLGINPVNRADTGMYKCIVSNGLNNGSDETSLVVFYGPENIRILPPLPVVAIVGSSLTLTCLALSEPGEYRWLKGNRWLQTEQEYTFDSVSSANRGNYTCLVTNYITKRNIRLAFQVTPTAAVTPGLTLGAVAGIVVGLIAAGLIGGVGATSATAAGNGLATYENLSGNTEQGLKMDERSVYSELRR